MDHPRARIRRGRPWRRPPAPRAGAWVSPFATSPSVPEPASFNGTRPCGDHRIHTGSSVDDGWATPVLRSSTGVAKLTLGRSAPAPTATPDPTEQESHLLDRVAGALAGRPVDDLTPRPRDPLDDLAAVLEGRGGGLGQAGLTRERTGAGRCGLQVRHVVTGVR